MKCIVLLFFLVLIVNISGTNQSDLQQHHLSKHHNHHKKHHHHKPKIAAASQEPHLLSEPVFTPEAGVDIFTCPLACVCQYAHFNDLPISRWINRMQMRQGRKSTAVEADSTERLINDNESVNEADESFPINPFIKQATCIIQGDNDVQQLVNGLPHDLQALILLYTESGRNKTVNISTLKPLNQLIILEIRGPQDRTFRLVFDEPLSFLQHANFESITLLGSDTFKRPKNLKHPSDSFDYKPKSEFFNTFVTDDGNAAAAASTSDSHSTKTITLGYEILPNEMEILPYDVYIMEVKKSRMPNFYGWEHLEVLRIHGCHLNELHWEMFDGLNSLLHLSLERNDIEVVPAFALYGALHIKTLSLAHNRIQDLHYRALAGLLDLEVLDLSENRLGKLSELSFPPFPKLEHVDFRHNPIRYIFPASFWIMNSTRVMLFESHETALELWGNVPFESLEQLKELDIGNVTISSLEQYVFKGLISLAKLKLRGDIRSIEFDAFAELNELRELDLSDCHIREISMDAFMGCKKLEVINLARNNISYIPPGLFDDQPALTEIYLQRNQLRTLPTTFFLQPKLRLARLTDNPWKCDCEMSNWRPKITNQERGLRTERCIADFQTGKQIACRRVDNFKYDHRHAPRCESHNGRSVFYVLRKQLKCGPGRVVHARAKHNRGLTTQRKPKLDKETSEKQKEQLAQERVNRKQVSTEFRINPPTWQIQREQKARRAKAQQNSLSYVLQQERFDLVMSRVNTTKVGEEVSNHI